MAIRHWILGMVQTWSTPGPGVARALAAFATAWATGGALTLAQSPPQVTLSNGPLKVLVYLPDARQGFFRGTRFDWAGVIGRLEYANHVYYDRWFSRMDPDTGDWAVAPEVIAGPNTAITGPAEEFQRPLGYDAAPAGGVFVKIGVGVLKKPSDGAAYSGMRLYEIADSGVRTLDVKSNAVTFTHDVAEPVSGYGYSYTKAIRLTTGQPELKLEHHLKNTGRQRIDTMVYDHNFLALDGLTTGAGFVVKTPYEIVSARPPNGALAEIRGRSVVYLADLAERQTVTTSLAGFGPTAADYDFRVEHTRAGAGVRITGDRPLANASLWSMQTTVAVEPFIAIGLEPGQEFNWTITYTYYLLDSPK
jgi:hypothetical protein